MYIQFNYQGATYKAGLTRQENDKVLVLFNDKQLEKQFGPSLPFYVKNHSVEFATHNRCHSDLFALNSSISRAIKEQCTELL